MQHDKMVTKLNQRFLEIHGSLLANSDWNPKSAYRPASTILQRIDGEMDVKVELQLLGQRVSISDGAGNMSLPQIEE